MRAVLMVCLVMGMGACSATTATSGMPGQPSESGGASTEAEELAERVMERAGHLKLAEAEVIEFAFVVSSEGREQFRAHHRFDRAAKTDRVTWVDPESPLGTRFDLVIDLEDKQVDGKVDGEPIEESQRARLAEAAYGRWVNDYYWYAMPLKLRDPGVKLSKLEPREWRGEGYETLEMVFEGVGLTPGDRYVLYVHPERERIERWDMDLQGREGEPIAVERGGFAEHGPLYLSHDHAWLDGARRVQIQKVTVVEEGDHGSYAFDDTDFAQDAFPGSVPLNNEPRLDLESR